MYRSARRLVTAMLLVPVVLGVAVLAGALATGQVGYVTTTGVSMNPVYYQGDLVVVARADSYKIGQIVAYRLPDEDLVILHRIIGGDASGYVIKGDNNQSTDPARPIGDQLIGRAVLHVAHGGIWFDRATSPTALGILAFVLLASGGGAEQTRRRKRKRSMSQHAHRVRPALTLVTLSPHLSTAAASVALVGVLGAALGVFAWTGPTVAAVTSETPSDQRIRFSYAAEVPRSAAYDDTTVQSPDPVFRTLTDSVDVTYAYEGSPGRVRVVAELSTTNGWRSTIPLTQDTRFDANSYEGIVTLDLSALERRAKAAADVIGVPADQVTVTVRPRFATAGGASFVAELPLTLSTAQLSLADPSALVVTDSATVRIATTAPRTLGMFGREMSVAIARTVSMVLLALALLGAAAVAVLAHLGAPGSEGAAIRRRHASILVPVAPMTTPSGRPVIDVSEFATLVKLAERYGLLVLHWSRSDVDTFVVQDESTTYRYRAAAEPSICAEDDLVHDSAGPRWSEGLGGAPTSLAGKDQGRGAGRS